MYKPLYTLAALLITTMALSACGTHKDSVKMAALKKSDKQLSCSQVKLEINEAEYYRHEAEKNKQPGIGSLVMPIGYIRSYMNANEAVDAADNRIDYLGRIYDILNCDQKHAQRTGHPAMPGRPARVKEYAPAAGNVPTAYMPVGYYPQHVAYTAHPVAQW